MTTPEVRCHQTTVVGTPPEQRVRVRCVLTEGHAGLCLVWGLDQQAVRWRADEPPAGPAPGEEERP